MASIPALQAYLRDAAAHTHEVYACPPFHLYLSEPDHFRFFNYAIPDHPLDALSTEQLNTLRAEFRSHERTLRFEFLQEFAPLLGPALDALGVPLEGANPLLVCTPGTRIPLSFPDGVTCIRLASNSPELDLADYIDTASRGFGEVDRGATTVRIEDLRRRLGLGNGASLVRLGDAPVAAGAYTAPSDGFAELVGIATLPVHRRQGIAGALTAGLADHAFGHGVHTAFLTAADADASRVYQRAGFCRVGTGLAYCDLQ